MGLMVFKLYICIVAGWQIGYGIVDSDIKNDILPSEEQVHWIRGIPLLTPVFVELYKQDCDRRSVQ